MTKPPPRRRSRALASAAGSSFSRLSAPELDILLSGQLSEKTCLGTVLIQASLHGLIAFTPARRTRLEVWHAKDAWKITVGPAPDAVLPAVLEVVRTAVLTLSGAKGDLGPRGVRVSALADAIREGAGPQLLQHWSAPLGRRALASPTPYRNGYVRDVARRSLVERGLLDRASLVRPLPVRTAAGEQVRALAVRRELAALAALETRPPGGWTADRTGAHRAAAAVGAAGALVAVRPALLEGYVRLLTEGAVRALNLPGDVDPSVVPDVRACAYVVDGVPDYPGRPSSPPPRHEPLAAGKG